MFDTLKKIFLSFILPEDEREGKAKEVMVEVKQKTLSFKSLFLLGDDFYAYHYDAKPVNFATWLKKNHVDWSNQHADLLRQFAKANFEDLVEQLYDLCYTKKVDDILDNYFRKWYVQEHGVFHFSVGERVFVTQFTNHLIQVLYNVGNAEILNLAQGTENVIESLGEPDNYKNNWLIGVDGNSDAAQVIVNHILSANDHTAVHFKLINDDGAKNEGIVNILKAKSISNYVELSISAMTTIPNDEPTRERFNRYDQFNDFAHDAKTKFDQLLNATPKAKRFNDFFMLNVWDDKNHPKNDTTYVNVGFGNRLLNVWHNHTGFTSTTEEGARLSFSRMETGYVTVMLFPAKTENRKPYEDFIILEHRISPAKFAERGLLKSYWNYLIAYMESTSIDGNPSNWQKLKVLWLRHSNNMVIDDVHQPTRCSVFWKKIWQFVLTVGLSGFVFYCLQFAYCIIKPDNTQQQYKEEVIQHIDSLRDAVKTSSDSISQTIKVLKEEKRNIKQK